jgi:hypothetical protein
MRVAALLCAGLAALVLPRAAAAEDAALPLLDTASGRVSVATPAGGGGYQVLDLRDGGLTLITPSSPASGPSQLHRR